MITYIKKTLNLFLLTYHIGDTPTLTVFNDFIKATKVDIPFEIIPQVLEYIQEIRMLNFDDIVEAAESDQLIPLVVYQLKQYK